MVRLVQLRLHPAVVHWRTTLAILLALGAMVAAVLAWIGYATIGITEPVVVATRMIPPGTRLTAADLTVVQLTRVRSSAWQGVPDPRMLIGAYTRIPLAPDQVVHPEYVQASPLGVPVFMPEKEGTPEVVQGVVFELSRTGLHAVAPRMRVNILVLVDAKRGMDPSFSVGAMDRPGSGARAVRVLRDVRVVHVTDRAALIDVTPEQSRYLWSLSAADIPFVGEVSAAADAPLGPLPPADFAWASALQTPGEAHGSSVDSPPESRPSMPATPAADAQPSPMPAAPPGWEAALSDPPLSQRHRPR